ncbi:MAG: hypothetical protein WCG28_00445 [bacterium]
MKNMKKNSKMSVGKKVVIGAGLAAVGAGAYYLLGPDAKVHQKKAVALLAKMKKEVQSEVKKVKDVSVPLYHKTVDAVSENYAKQYKVYEKDIKTLAKKLKSEWKSVK